MVWMGSFHADVPAAHQRSEYADARADQDGMCDFQVEAPATRGGGGPCSLTSAPRRRGLPPHPAGDYPRRLRHADHGSRGACYEEEAHYRPHLCVGLRWPAWLPPLRHGARFSHAGHRIFRHARGRWVRHVLPRAGDRRRPADRARLVSLSRPRTGERRRVLRADPVLHLSASASWPPPTN